MTWKPPQATVIEEPQGWTPPGAVAVSEPQTPTFGQRATEAAELWVADPVREASEINKAAWKVSQDTGLDLPQSETLVQAERMWAPPFGGAHAAPKVSGWEVVADITDALIPDSPYRGDDDKLAREFSERPAWFAKWLVTAGGNLPKAPEGQYYGPFDVFTSYRSLEATKPELTEELQNFAGFGSAILPVATNSVKAAIEWGVVYPAMFRAAGLTGQQIARIPQVAKAGKTIADAGGLTKLAQQYPATMGVATEAAKGFAKGGAVGMTRASVEGMMKDLDSADLISEILLSGVEMGTIGAVFQGAVGWSKASLAKRMAAEYVKRAPQLGKIPEQDLYRTAEAAIDSTQVKIGMMTPQQWHDKHAEHLYQFSQKLKTLNEPQRQAIRNLIAGKGPTSAPLQPEASPAAERAPVAAPEASRRAGTTAKPQPAPSTGQATAEGLEWLRALKAKADSGAELTPGESRFVAEMETLAGQQMQEGVPDETEAAPQEVPGVPGEGQAAGVGETPTVAESARVATEAPAGEGRQAWEMTREEAQAVTIRTKDGVEPLFPGDTHRQLVEQAVSDGKPVPRAVLEEYAGEPWADEALSKLEAETPLVMTEEQYLASKGYGMAAMGDPALDRMPGLAPGNRKREGFIKAQAEKDKAWEQKRAELRQEYAEKVATGEIRPPTRTEKLIATAQGHPDNESVQAARRILEKQGISWEAETPPVRPSEPRETEPAREVVREGVPQAGGQAEAAEPTPEYKRTRKTELAKITRAIKSHPAYQQEVEARAALSETPTALGTVYVPKEYRGDVEAYAGEKGKPGANKALWDRITFDPKAGQHWDDAAAELGWPDTFDGFMERFAMSVEGGVDPDIAAVAENSGLPELETLAIKRDMLLANEPIGRINAEIEANLIEGARGGTYPMTVEDAQILANQLKIGGAEGEISVGAAAGNWQSRRRAIDRAQKLSKKEGKPYYVSQQQGGRFMAKDAPPKKGYYTLVDMSRPFVEQTTFIKQASETAEGSFDYGEHPKKSQRHMTALQKFKAKIKAKDADTDAIRQEIYDYIRTNVDRADQHRFLPLLNKVTSKRQTKTNLKDLGKAIAETEQLLRYNDKRDAVQEFIDTVKQIRKDYRAGIKQFGKLDKFTRDRVQTLLGDIDPQTLSDRKQADLESLGKYLQGIAQRLRDGLITEAEAQEAAMNIPASRLAGLSRIGKKPLRKMETGDIREMTKMLKQYVSNFELKKQLRGRRRAIALAEADAGIRSEMVPRRKFVPTDDTTARAGRGILGRFFTTESAHLDTLVEFLTANDSEMARKIFDEDLAEGARVRDGLERKALMRIRERLAEIGLTAKDFRRMTELREVSIGGETVKITAEDLMALYRHSRDEYNLRALLDAPGYRIGNKNTKPFTGVEELYEALDQLSDQERAYADLYAEINRTVTAPAVNKASVELEGFELADNPTYWPIRYVQAVRAAGGTSDIAIEDFGRYQPRVGGTGRLRIVPYSHEMLRCIQEDATYAGMMVPLHNARTILNQRDLQDYARDIGQKDTLEAIIQILRNVQGNPSSASIAEKLGRGVLNKYAQSVLSLRISTIGTQVGSLPAALAEIDPKYAVGVVPSQERLRKLEERSDVLWKRWSSRHITIEMGNIAASHAPEMLFFETHPWAEKPLKALVASDRQTIGLIAGMVENEIRATRPDLAVGSDAYWDAVARRTEQVVRRTQPMWDMLNRSSLGADPGVWKRSILMFRSALEAQYNILLRAHNRYAKSDKSMDEKLRLAKAQASVVASAGMVAIWKRLLKMALAAGATGTMIALGIKDPTEDDDESAAEVAKDMAIDTGQNMLGLLPGGNLFGQVIRNTVEVAAGESTWGREPYDTPIGDLINGIGTTAFVRTPKLARAMATEDWEAATDEAIRIMDDGLDLTAKLTGMPYSGPRSEIIRPIQKAAKEDKNKSRYRTVK
jgi:hypothetical protein